MNASPPEPQNAAQTDPPALQPACCPILNAILALTAALIAGTIGHYLFFIIANQGFYTIVLPGTLMGLACGAVTRRKSNCLAAICAVLALIAGIITEWRFAPFIADESLSYFLTHLHQMTNFTKFLIILGAAFAFYFAKGRKKTPQPQPQEPPA